MWTKTSLFALSSRRENPPDETAGAVFRIQETVNSVGRESFPSKKIAIAVAVTFTPEAFDSQGNYKNSSDTVFRSIGTYLVADDAPPQAKD